MVEQSSLETLLKAYLTSDKERLDRIENKIDSLAETVVSLARLEEKQMSLEIAKEAASRVDLAHERRIDAIEKRLAELELGFSSLKKLFWGIVVPVLLVVVGTAIQGWPI